MIEFLASALVAAAAIAFVVEPLTRRSPRNDEARDPPLPAQLARAQQLVTDVAARLSPRCPSCGAVSDSPALYCWRCGHVLLEDGGQASSPL